MTGAPRNPGIKPDGIRDRALRALGKRGPRVEDRRKTAASKAYWTSFKKERPANKLREGKKQSRSEQTNKG